LNHPAFAIQIGEILLVFSAQGGIDIILEKDHILAE